MSLHMPGFSPNSNHSWSVRNYDDYHLIELNSKIKNVRNNMKTTNESSSVKRGSIREIQHYRAKERQLRRERKLMDHLTHISGSSYAKNHPNKNTLQMPLNNAQKYIKKDKSYIKTGRTVQRDSSSISPSKSTVANTLSNIGKTKHGENGHSKQDQMHKVALLFHHGGPTAPGPADHLMNTTHKAGRHVLWSTLKPKGTNGSKFQPIDPHLDPNKPFSASMTHQGWLKDHPTFGRLLARLTGLLTKGNKLTPFAQGAVNKSNRIIPNRGIMKDHSINKLYGSAAKQDQQPMGKQLGGNNLYHNQVAKANSQNYNPSNQPQVQPGQ